MDIIKAKKDLAIFSSAIYLDELTPDILEATEATMSSLILQLSKYSRLPAEVDSLIEEVAEVRSILGSQRQEADARY